MEYAQIWKIHIISFKKMQIHEYFFLYFLAMEISRYLENKNLKFSLLSLTEYLYCYYYRYYFYYINQA